MQPLRILCIESKINAYIDKKHAQTWKILSCKVHQNVESNKFQAVSTILYWNKMHDDGCRRA